MSFIPKNPLTIPEITSPPSPPDPGKRGLFAKEDGWYEIDSNNKVTKITGGGGSEIEKKALSNGYKYYGDAGIIPSDQDLFSFDVNVNTKTATLKRPDGIDMYTQLDLDGDIVIPYEYKIENGDLAGIYKVTKIGNAAFYWSNITSVHIPNTITEIEANAFAWCPNIKSIKIPDSVKTIGNSVCEFSTSLESITIGSGITEIPEGFVRDTSIKKIHMPEGIKSIGTHAFAGCSLLEECIIPDSVTYMGRIFGDYNALKRIKMSNNIEGLDTGFFMYSQNLSSVDVGDSVKIIGDMAFYGSPNLKSVTLPASLTNINEYAFTDCNSLTDIYFKGSAEQWHNIVIGAYNEPLTNAHIHYNVVPATEGYVNEQIKNISVTGGSAVYAYVNIRGGINNWTSEDVLDSSGNIIGSRYGQVVNVNNAEITPNSKVDLQITSEQMVVFYEKSLAFVAENDDGVITVYCVGSVPQNDHTMQAVVTEVIV